MAAKDRGLERELQRSASAEARAEALRRLENLVKALLIGAILWEK
jgi:hypothetical protein